GVGAGHRAVRRAGPRPARLRCRLHAAGHPLPGGRSPTRPACRGRARYARGTGRARLRALAREGALPPSDARGRREGAGVEGAAMTGDGPERPWPVVQIGGELERAEREWIHTNGTGAYAMSTLALMHTRRHHAILAAALEPPFGRYLVLSHAETSVQVGDRSYRLSTHQFPNLAPTPGYRLLQSFAQDPLPRWTYRLGKAELERRLCL